MDDLQTLLARIGFRPTRSEPESWQVRRVEPPLAMRARSGEPAPSPVLMSWLKRLRDRRRPLPYQISLALHIAAAEDHLGRHTL
jgi:hypothetical protein